MSKAPGRGEGVRRRKTRVRTLGWWWGILMGFLGLLLVALWNTVTLEEGPRHHAVDRTPAIVKSDAPAPNFSQDTPATPVLPEPSTPLSTITGRLFWKESGVAIEGKKVSLDSWFLEHRPSPLLGEARSWSTVTEASGRFAFNDIPPGDYVLSREEWPGAVWLRDRDRIHVFLSENEHATDIDMPIEQAVPVGGHIVDAQGFPISGARVRVGFAWGQYREVWTDALGRYRFELLGSREDASLQVSARGYAIQTRRIDHHRPEMDNFDFRLSEPGHTFSGRVVNDCGTPIPNAIVTTPIPRWYTMTDASGQFELSGIKAQEEPLRLELYLGDFKLPLRSGGGPYTFGTGTIQNGLLLVASIRGFVEDLYPVQGNDCGSVMTRGRVLDAEGRPLAGMDVRGMAGDGIAAATLSAADGSYALALGAGSDCHLVVISGRYERAYMGEVPCGSENNDFYLDAARAIEGQVIDAATGAPIRGFQLAIVEASEYRRFSSSPFLHQNSKGIFDAEGRFYWPSVRTEAEMGRVFAEGYAPQSFEARPGEQPIVIAMERGRRISGMVRDETGTPVSNTVVIASSEVNIANKGFGHDGSDYGSLTTASTYTDSLGKFSFDGLEAAPHFLEAGIGRYGYKMEEVDLSHTEERYHQIDVINPGVICGAISVGGWPVAGAQVNAKSDNASEYLGKHFDISIADEDGRFVMDTLLPGIYEVSLSFEGFPNAPDPIAPVLLEIHPGETYQIDYAF